MVETYIAEDPEASAELHAAVQSGIRSALEESKERAADMENALAVVISGKVMKDWKEYTKEQLRKWDKRTVLRWDWFLEKEDK